MKRLIRRVVAGAICIGLIAAQLTVQAEDGGSGGTAVAPTTGAHGSGSYQLNEVETDYRFYTEYFVEADTKKSITTAGIARRTTIKVYAKAGEVILFGSSVANSQINEDNVYTRSVTGTDIVITTPDGSKIKNDVLLPGEKDKENNTRPNGLGYIKNPTQEKNGPMVNSTDESKPDEYYVPLRYEVPADGAGVYIFEFHSVTGFNPNSASSGYHPTPLKAGEQWKQGNTAVAAWDVTVLGKVGETTNWEVKSGRAWADYLALTTGGGEGVESDLDVHVLTHDGYQYKVDFKEAVPYGFIFFANNTGFMTATTDENSEIKSYSPIYHSFYDSSNDLDYMDSENICLHKPNEADSDTQETYKIFFNAPNPDLDGVTYKRKTEIAGVVTEVDDRIKTDPDTTVEITNLVFSGINGNQHVARAGHGGYFTFDSTGEAMVTIRMDLRKAIYESKGTMDEYEGSGLVEITAPVRKTDPANDNDLNRIYWDGKDTDGITLPAGIYGNNNVVISTEVKRGEIHFPVIDMEGLNGGLTIKRLNGDGADDAPERYNLYYNNNPLAYGTIEGLGYNPVTEGNYNKLSDGTKSYRASNGGLSYFKGGQNTISTLLKDDKEYLSQKLFGKSYSELDAGPKSIIDAEFVEELDTFHFEPVDSRNVSINYGCKDFTGGGNQAGIDVWTYYSQGINSSTISFALMDSSDRGLVTGGIFYDANVSSSEDSGDYPLAGIKVRLLDSAGEPLVHEESLPRFDETGHFIYNPDGTVEHINTPVVYETVTDSKGTYRFTGVPYSSTENTTYYVQVMLSDVQTEVMRYTCTTSDWIKTNLTTGVGGTGVHFITAADIGDAYGADGNRFVEVTDGSKIYRHKYARNDQNETVFDLGTDNNTQKVTFVAGSTADLDLETGIRTQTFKKIGYGSTVPTDHQKDYKVVKDWGEDSQGNATHQISDGLTVELWVWNDNDVQEENTFKTNRRTGALVDTQVLQADTTNPEKNWTYTWKDLDDRLQYYVLEYYTKKKPNGEVIYNDKGEARLVLIGGTMPLFSYVPSSYAATGIYGFQTDLGEYYEPNPVEYPAGSGKLRIPIQRFNENDSTGDTLVHANSITKAEKLEAVDNNARQYDVTYTLSTEDAGKTNVITLTNSQKFDDRAYYVWLDHQRVLPDMIAQTYVEDDERKSHALELEKDKNLGGGYWSIKGLSISSVDAAESENVEGNATNAFCISDDASKYNNEYEQKHSALFTATDKGNYKTGTGTRTYQVKFVEDVATKKPVSVTTNEQGELVLSSNPNIKVEETSGYTVYSWYMTIHVYNLVSDGVIEYNPDKGPVVLQEALGAGQELTWTLKHDNANQNAVTYESDDNRSQGILSNDTYRVPLYKAATEPDMGSCADLIGIAYAGSTANNVDSSKLEYEDTYESRYGTKQSYSGEEDEQAADTLNDGRATIQGNGGALSAFLNVSRNSRINRKQDHANYAEVIFTPNQQDASGKSATGEDVFYYRVAVFAEDNTYQYYQYEDIDASEGVVMDAYFTMKVNPDLPEEETKPTEETEENQDILSPPTGDERRLLLWICLFIFGATFIGVEIKNYK